MSSFFDRWSIIADLSGETEDDLLMAGVDRLAAFGYLNTLLELVQVTGMPYTEILEQPAGTIYAIIAREAVKADIQKKLKDIQRKKAKV